MYEPYEDLENVVLQNVYACLNHLLLFNAHEHYSSHKPKPGSLCPNCNIDRRQNK